MSQTPTAINGDACSTWDVPDSKVSFTQVRTKF